VSIRVGLCSAFGGSLCSFSSGLGTRVGRIAFRLETLLFALKLQEFLVFLCVNPCALRGFAFLDISRRQLKFLSYRLIAPCHVSSGPFCGRPPICFSSQPLPRTRQIRTDKKLPTALSLYRSIPPAAIIRGSFRFIYHPSSQAWPLPDQCLVRNVYSSVPIEGIAMDKKIDSLS
jgi:hypothetical protein